MAELEHEEECAAVHMAAIGLHWESLFSFQIGAFEAVIGEERNDVTQKEFLTQRGAVSAF